MSKKNKPRVLCVDDEPAVLDGLKLRLRRRFSVFTANRGDAALQMVQEDDPFAIIVSDMRMPAMNGATLLAKVRDASPDTVRVLLTGYSEMDAAIAAVNEGQIFRFLTKPCPPDQLEATLLAAAEQHRLLTSERVLLEQTLRGSVQTLVEVLSLTSPATFGRGQRVQRLVSELGERVGLAHVWGAEVAALLHQLGAISLPADVVAKLRSSAHLNDEERAMVERIPEVTAKLLGNIPRLEPVLEIIARVHAPSKRGQTEVDRAAAILRLASDYDQLEAAGEPTDRALATLRGRRERYCDEDVEHLAAMVKADSDEIIRELALSAITVGMVFVDDVRTSGGTLLVARGYEVTEGFVQRARNFRPGFVVEPLRVRLPAAPEPRLQAVG